MFPAGQLHLKKDIITHKMYRVFFLSLMLVCAKSERTSQDKYLFRPAPAMHGVVYYTLSDLLGKI